MPEYKREKDNCKVVPNPAQSLDLTMQRLQTQVSGLVLKFQVLGFDTKVTQFGLPDFKGDVSKLQDDLTTLLCALRGAGGNVPADLASMFDRLFDGQGNFTGVAFTDIISQFWNRIMQLLFPGGRMNDFLNTLLDRLGERWNPTDGGGELPTFNSEIGIEAAIRSSDDYGAGDPDDDMEDVLGRIRDRLENAVNDLTTEGYPLMDTGAGDVLFSLDNPVALAGEDVEREVLTGHEPSDKDLVDMLTRRIDEQNVRESQVRGGSYFCPEMRFDARHYVRVNQEDGTAPIMTPRREQSLRDIYNRILKPIVDFYMQAGMVTEPGCALIIVLGLASRRQVAASSGNSVSKHIDGEAVDFIIRTVSPLTVFRDIANGVIPVTYGVMTFQGGYVHITLPYVHDGERIEKLAIMPESGGTLSDIAHTWR